MALPSWWSPAGERKDRNKRSARQEREHAKAHGGRVQRGSGSSWRAPQDVVLPERMDQLKFTDKQSFVIKVSELQQILRDAVNAGRDPALIVEFTTAGIRLTASIEEMQ